MTRVFLSYTEADAQLARRVADALRAAGAQVFHSGDRENTGGPFIETIQTELEAADLLVTLLSPEYLRSSWCRREVSFGLHRESQLKRQFVYVFHAQQTDFAGTGFLRAYDWISLLPPTSDDAVRAAVGALGIGNPRTEPLAAREHEHLPLFRNRKDELSAVVSELTATGGQDLWLVLAPPKMGKSWFLDQVTIEVERRRPGYYDSRLVDLRKDQATYQSDWVALLCELLNVHRRDVDVPSEQHLREIAVELSRRFHPQLYVLDSVELLVPSRAGALRRALTRIYHLVKETEVRETRIAIVVGSRRVEEWEGYEYSADTPDLFETLQLTGFGPDVVREALRDSPHYSLSNGRLRSWTEKLHALSEGLPELLLNALQWAAQGSYLGLDTCETEETFNVVARPYVRQSLLTDECLVPLAGRDVDERRRVVERALRRIVPYRTFTQSHLQTAADEDARFAQLLAGIGWSVGEVWSELNRIALLKPSEGPELTLDPPIRRLLYRYFYPSRADQEATHLAARDLYERWWTTAAGLVEGVTLFVECLWHDANLLRYRGITDPLHALPATAADLAGHLTGETMTSRYQPSEIEHYAISRLKKDKELLALLQPHPGLFDRVVGEVEKAIRGGAR